MIIQGHYNYWVVIVLMMVGLYVLIAHGNLLKKVIGLNVFQTSAFILYISLANISSAAPPVIKPEISLYSNPLPHVLILTAIVVGISTTAVALALILRIKEAYGTIEEEKILEKDRESC